MAGPASIATRKAGFADTLGRDPNVCSRLGNVMVRVFLLIVLGGALLLWLNPPGPEHLERWGLDLSAFFPKPLTPEEVVRYTNEFRNAHGLPPLTVNPALNAAAQARALDMKTHRYFAHQNPETGEGPGEAIEAVGYVARVSAENIAKGSWRSDRALVQGWIDSPGHRSNILNPDIREIGVALVRDGGIIAGRPVAGVYAVQLFGRPLSDCGELPSERDRAAIEEVDGRLGLLNARLRDRRRELDDLQARVDRAGSQTERNRWIQERNQRVVEFNQLVAEAKGIQDTLSVMIETFNAKESDFNTCGAGT